MSPRRLESILGKTNYARSFRAQRRYVDVATRNCEAHVIGQCLLVTGLFEMRYVHLNFFDMRSE